MSKARNYLIAAASVLATSALLVTPTTAQTVNLVERSGAWSIYADTGTPKKVCFAASSPQAVEPIGANRGSIFFYISAWPKDGVKAEPSVKLGYPVNTEKGVTVTIGTDVFKLLGSRGVLPVIDADPVSICQPCPAADDGRGPAFARRVYY